MEKHRGTLAEWLAKLAGHSANQLAVEIEEDDKMLLLGKPQAVVLAGNINSAGTVTGNSATGTVPVTEPSAATISTNTSYLSYIESLVGETTTCAVPVVSGQVAAHAMARHRIYTVAVTIAAGGAITNIPLHATQAGYKFHFKVLGIIMDVSDATTTWWFHTTAGGLSCTGCPATPGFSPVNLTATTVNTQLTGAFMNNQAATGDVTLLDVAGVGAGAANGFIYLEGWFETT